ncbi:TetR family transcriptional regulator [Actinocorallia sp. A-T 12471]|uniref:TetR family transcriptional regulator n=1 Tax=Actinocorallia sp. A-T 12471 TaxID=3089813 RepID=UPI0029D2B989|nr:TetR family transcriptional regulator [Actinocorallia sp. A-T 12471]MDX6740118.1 TetR family transcriptional regulator [Actinocorallia sp. A-T 12471]
MEGPSDFRHRVRRQLRDDAIDAAYTILVRESWASVRMTAVAKAVGVSRQTLYKEFATKEEIGHALVQREAGRFIDGFTAQTARVDAVPDLVEAAVRFGFEHGPSHRMLVAILAEQRGESLLPFVTTDAGALVAQAAEVLAAPIRELAPHLDAADVTETCDALIRLMVSHLLQPRGDAEAAAAGIVRLALRGLGL